MDGFLWKVCGFLLVRSWFFAGAFRPRSGGRRRGGLGWLVSGGSGSGLGFLGGRLGFPRGGEDGVKGCALHAGHELDQAGVTDIDDEAIDDLIAKIAVGHLTSFEAQGGLDLVALVEEAEGLVLFGLVVVLVDGNGELDLFDDDDFLLLACCSLALIFFVEVFAVVLDFADWRDGVGGDLYEVEGTLPGHLEGLEGSHDSELFAILVDDADFAGTNTFVGADERFCGTFINWWNKSPPQRVPFLAALCLGIRCNSWKRLPRNLKYNTCWSLTGGGVRSPLKHDVNSQTDEYDRNQQVPDAVHSVQDVWVVPEPSPDRAPQGNEECVRGQDQPKVLAIDVEERDIDPYVVCSIRQRNQSYGHRCVSIRC